MSTGREPSPPPRCMPWSRGRWNDLGLTPLHAVTVPGNERVRACLCEGARAALQYIPSLVVAALTGMARTVTPNEGQQANPRIRTSSLTAACSE